MNDLLGDPFFQSSVAPLALGFVAAGAFRAAAGPRVAAAGVLAALLGVYLWVVGLPALPPPSSMGKLFWAGVAGLILALVLDLARIGGAVRNAATLIWSAAALSWILGGNLSAPADAAVFAVALVAAAIAAFVPSADGDESAVSAGAPAFAWALATGGVALIGASASLAQLGLALTAATGGFMLWNWPKPRFVWGAAGRATQSFVVLPAAVLAVFSSAPAVALIPALFAPLGPRLARRIPTPDNAVGAALRPALAVIFAVVPALVSLGAAFALTAGESSPY